MEGEPRPVHVHGYEVLWREGDRAALEIRCSAGTYVRQLVAALGDAYCEQLERTAIGAFRLADADPDRLVPLKDALAFLPERPLDDDEAARIAHGRAISCERDPTPGWEAWPPVRLVHDGELLALAVARDQELHPDVVFVP